MTWLSTSKKPQTVSSGSRQWLHTFRRNLLWGEECSLPSSFHVVQLCNSGVAWYLCVCPWLDQREVGCVCIPWCVVWLCVAVVYLVPLLCPVCALLVQ